MSVVENLPGFRLSRSLIELIQHANRSKSWRVNNGSEQQHPDRGAQGH